MSVYARLQNLSVAIHHACTHVVATIRSYVIQNIIIAIIREVPLPHSEVPVPHSGMCDVRNAGSFDTNPPPYFDS